MIKTFKWALISSLCFATTSFAEQGSFSQCSIPINKLEYRVHKTHKHGQVNFNLAQDGADIILAVTAPGLDILGFEHTPKATQETSQLEQAVNIFERPMALFQFSQGANCKLIEQLIEAPQVKSQRQAMTDFHNQPRHTTFEISYQFQCPNIAKLMELDTTWFALFPNTQEIHVNLLSDKSQQVLALTPYNTSISM